MGAMGGSGAGGVGGMPDANVQDGAPDASCASDEDDSGIDCCPDDPEKTEPGACGCGASELDEDADSVPDCNDACPMDPNKTQPGECGCGLLEEDNGAQAGCLGPKNALLHRYRFDGSGNTAEDSVGDADGTLVNATLDGSGTLSLSGGSSDAYVNLPNGILSPLTDATIEIWLVWNGGNSWQRVFDFGSNSGANEGDQGTGSTYLFFTPSVASANVARFAYASSGSASEERANASGPLQTGTLVHVAAVVDDTGNQLRLYINGAQAASGAFSGALSSITDINNWIGRSQYETDSELGATLHELRIYGAALSPEQITLTFEQGADPEFLEP
jgi:hypothetical protein